jgi:predicted ATPase
VDRALKTIADAFGAAPEETMHLPELHRLRGDFMLLEGDPENLQAIEKDYRQALAISGQFDALAQELRAATRLAALLGSQGRSGEARELLAPVYARFTEGFDQKDLIAARNILQEFTVRASAEPSK